LQEVSKKTAVKIIWPNHELADDVVTLLGPQSNLESATQMVRQMVSDVYCFRVPFSTQLITVLSSTVFKEQVVHRLQHEMDIAVDVDSVLANATTKESTKQNDHSPSSSSPVNAHPMSPSSNDGNDFDGPNCSSCVIPLQLNKTNLDHLPFALDILVCHLRENHVPLYKETINDVSDINTRSSSNNSATDNYSHHFGSKLLPSVIPPGKKEERGRHERDCLHCTFFIRSTIASWYPTHSPPPIDDRQPHEWLSHLLFV
jgi:hypothetical protein